MMGMLVIKAVMMMMIKGMTDDGVECHRDADVGDVEYRDIEYGDIDDGDVEDGQWAC